jgi:hypothetical protein
MVTTQIELTEKQMKLLKKKAALQKSSIKEMVQKAIEALIKSNVSDERGNRSRAIEAAGRFHSGKSDLSTNHDKYLSEDLGK